MKSEIIFSVLFLAVGLATGYKVGKMDSLNITVGEVPSPPCALDNGVIHVRKLDFLESESFAYNRGWKEGLKQASRPVIHSIEIKDVWINGKPSGVTITPNPLPDVPYVNPMIPQGVCTGYKCYGTAEGLLKCECETEPTGITFTNTWSSSGAK